MTPQRARTYVWLFGALVMSVSANLFVFQPRDGNSQSVTNAPRTHKAAGGPEAKALRVTIGGGKQRADPAEFETVRAVQRELKQMGYYPGRIDGRVSYLTHAAIFAFEHDNSLPLTAEPSQKLLKVLILGPSRLGSRSTVVPRVAHGSAAERLLRDIKVKLVDLGYGAGNHDGRMTAELIQAIRAFEADSGLKPTGLVGAGLMMHLYRSTAAFHQRRT